MTRRRDDQPSRHEARRALLSLEVPLGALGAALVLLALAFARWGIPLWLPASPAARTGIPSPLSGMTRSFVALAAGDLRGAFRWHPLGPAVFAVCALAPLVAGWSWWRARRLEWLARRLRRRGVWVAVAGVSALAWAWQAARLPS